MRAAMAESTATEAARVARAAAEAPKANPGTPPPETPADTATRADAAPADDAAAAALVAGVLAPSRAPSLIKVLSPTFADLSDKVKSKIAALPVLRPGGLNLGAAANAARPPPVAYRLRSGSKS